MQNMHSSSPYRISLQIIKGFFGLLSENLVYFGLKAPRRVGTCMDFFMPVGIPRISESQIFSRSHLATRTYPLNFFAILHSFYTIIVYNVVFEYLDCGFLFQKDYFTAISPPNSQISQSVNFPTKVESFAAL